MTTAIFLLLAAILGVYLAAYAWVLWRVSGMIRKRDG